MPRWEHGSEKRLQEAAMELSAEQGFEETSAVQIAARARVTTRTLLRYFPDKEEILFADADALRNELAGQLDRAADVSEPLLAVTRTLAGHPWEKLGSRSSQSRRTALIASNARLREREPFKQQQIADDFRDILGRRGIDADTAAVAADTGIHVFRTAYRRWLAGGPGEADLPTLAEQALSLLATLVPGRTDRRPVR